MTFNKLSYTHPNGFYWQFDTIQSIANRSFNFQSAHAQALSGTALHKLALVMLYLLETVSSCKR